MGYTNYTLIFEILLGAGGLYLVYNLLKNGKLMRRIGKKNTVISLIIMIIIFLGFTFIRPMVMNIYNIKKIIKESDLNNYIISYNLSGYKDSTITIKAEDSFTKLDNKTKFQYMDSVRESVDISILGIYSFGENKEKLMKLGNDNKVIINVNGNKYMCYQDELTLNGKQIYKKEYQQNETDYNDDIEIPQNNTPLNNEEETEIRVLTKKVISDRLKVPSSAKFCGYNELKIRCTNDGRYVAEGWVEGENDFGGTVRNNFTVVFERKNDHMYATEINID